MTVAIYASRHQVGSNPSFEPLAIDRQIAIDLIVAYGHLSACTMADDDQYGFFALDIPAVHILDDTEILSAVPASVQSLIQTSALDSRAITIATNDDRAWSQPSRTAQVTIRTSFHRAGEPTANWAAPHAEHAFRNLGIYLDLSGGALAEISATAILAAYATRPSTRDTATIASIARYAINQSGPTATVIVT